MRLTVIIMILCIIGGCKKAPTITQTDLVGKWNELQPCRGTSNCINIQFNADSTFYRSNSAFTDTGFYGINNSRLIFYRIGHIADPPDGYALVVHNNSSITVKNVVVCYGCAPNTGDDTYLDLNLQKQ